MVDVTIVGPSSPANKQKLSLEVNNLARWLMHHQPISLAVSTK